MQEQNKDNVYNVRDQMFENYVYQLTSTNTTHEQNFHIGNRKSIQGLLKTTNTCTLPTRQITFSLVEHKIVNTKQRMEIFCNVSEEHAWEEGAWIMGMFSSTPTTTN